MKPNSKVQSRRPPARNIEKGFSILETIFVVAMMTVVAAMAYVKMQPAIQEIRANAGMDQVVGELRTARELAISERRNIQVQFLNNNEMVLTRMNVPTGTSVFSDLTLENTVTFTLFPGVPDTPDGFGNAFAIDIGNLNGGPPTMMFQSDGTFVDTNGNLLNGSIFLGVSGFATTARAVTILGATGRVRPYRATPTGWIR